MCRKILRALIIAEWIALTLCILILIVSLQMISITNEQISSIGSILFFDSLKGVLALILLIPFIYMIRSFLEILYIEKEDHNITEFVFIKKLLDVIQKFLICFLMFVNTLYIFGTILVMNWVPVQDATEETLREVQKEIAINYNLGSFILRTSPYFISGLIGAILIIYALKLVFNIISNKD